MRIRTIYTITVDDNYENPEAANEFAGGALDILRAEVAGWSGESNVTAEAIIQPAPPAMSITFTPK